MLVVRNCFTAKPGQATKLAAQIKEAAETGKFSRFRVLTDLTGDFNRVVLEFEVESVAEFERIHSTQSGSSPAPPRKSPSKIDGP